jgi:hypothetical protein
MEEFDILRAYMTTMEPNLDMVEESIIYGILSQLVTDYNDTEPELYFE